MILNGATILVLIAALIYTWMAARYSNQSKKMAKELEVFEQKSLIQSKLLKKMNFELNFWIEQRKLFEGPLSIRKKKIRGKRRKRG